MHYLVRFEGELLKWAYGRPYSNSFPVRALIFMGDGPFWLFMLFIFALAGRLLKMEFFHELTILLMTGLLISNIMFNFCKTRIKRVRPYADGELQRKLGITIENRDPGHASKEKESFPSGHVLWTTLCVVLICARSGYIPVLLIGWMIPAMVYLRLHLGVHYPSDVLAGLVLGCVNAAVALLLNPYLMVYIDVIKEYPGYAYGYWAVICIFLIIGFKTWLKRI